MVHSLTLAVQSKVLLVKSLGRTRSLLSLSKEALLNYTGERQNYNIHASIVYLETRFGNMTESAPLSLLTNG